MGGGTTVELEPTAPFMATPLVFRARLRGSQPGWEPWLVAGELSSYFARALERGEVPTSLRERALPLRYWYDGDDCLVQPLESLEPGATYSLGLLGAGVVQVLRAAPDAVTPRERVFPAPGRPKRTVSLECGLALEGDRTPLELAPGAVPLHVDRSWTEGLGSDCALLRADAPLRDPAVSPPNWLDAPLEPSLWLPPDRSPATSTECSEGDSLHDACIEIDDDRIFVTPRRHDQLWFLREPEPRWVVAEPAARRLLIGHLDPGSALVLQGARLDADGQQDDFELQVSLRKPRRHVIINEVLANPLGAEASGEWMEILNDSAGGVSLAGLWLEDTRGRVPLPAAELAPGELALLVAPGFRAVPPDVPVLANVRVLELSSLGERGLANSGEMVLLVGPEGIVSRFPALSAAHAGRSWARVRLDAADDDPRAFAEHGSPGASPGAENNFDPPASSRR